MPKIERDHATAPEKAAKIWNAASPAEPEHPYLTRKGIQPHGARAHGDALVIPVRDAGELRSWVRPEANGPARTRPPGPGESKP